MLWNSPIKQYSKRIKWFSYIFTLTRLPKYTKPISDPDFIKMQRKIGH
jgi:hypothetical protein